MRPDHYLDMQKHAAEYSEVGPQTFFKTLLSNDLSKIKPKPSGSD